MTTDSFKTRGSLQAGGKTYEVFSLDVLARSHPAVRQLPFSLRVLLENLLRHEDGRVVKREHIEKMLAWNPKAAPETEISFHVARVLLQDFTGVPAVVDLAGMREALAALGGDPNKINPRNPADLVIDHSVVVDQFGSIQAFQANADLEFDRNRERYAFLRWGQGAFRNFRVVPPDTGICHQVNLEFLAQVVFSDGTRLYPDTLVGTDSHTTMVNGLGVVGWGVGGIEAEAALLGQPLTMLIPQVVGFRLSGKLPPGATATDLVLTVTQMLRKKGVVGKFVEFFGPGIGELSLPDRATIANMAPEYGATIGFFPVDAQTLAYLRFTGRPAAQVELVEAYCKAQGLLHTAETPEPVFSDLLSLDLGTVEPSLAGPKRPQDRVPLKDAKKIFQKSLLEMVNTAPPQDEDAAPTAGSAKPAQPVSGASKLSASAVVNQGTLSYRLQHGAVVIAAITSCTNTSNPAVLLAAGLLAKKAVERGLGTKPWVKTSLAPGSKVVMDYLRSAGLVPYLEALGFHLVGYGCTTCIGNSRPAAGAHRQRGDRAGPDRRRGALGQPELRGPHQPLRPDELPRQPSAGGRLRAGGRDGHRPRHRAPGGRPQRQSGLPEGHLAVGPGDPRGRRRARQARAVPEPVRARARGGRALAEAASARPPTPSPGTRRAPTSAARRSSRTSRRSRRRCRTSRARGCSPCWATR